MKWVFTFLGFLFLILGSFGFSQEEIQQIQTDIDNGSYALAANISGPNAIELYPENSLAHFLYAKSLYLLGKIDQARAELNIALSLNPKNEKDYMHLNGLLLANEGDTYSARAFLKEAFEAQDSYIYAMDWARVAWQSGHIDEALIAFGLAAETKQGSTEGWPLLNIGKLLYNQGKYEDAISAYKKAIRLFDAQDNALASSPLPSPGYVDAFYLLGQSYEALGDIERAITNYKSVTNLDPNLLAASHALERLQNE